LTIIFSFIPFKEAFFLILVTNNETVLSLGANMIYDITYCVIRSWSHPLGINYR